MVNPDTIQFTCASCGHSATLPKVQEGKAIYCPQCQAAQVVRGPAEIERIATGRIAKAESAPPTDRIARQPFGTPARIDFVCGACNHTSRISSTLAGQPVRCPTCGTVQLAGVAGLRVVRLDGSGKLPFTCSACGYQARLSADYGGKAIRCPKCQGAQVVPRVLRDPSGAQPALPSGAVVVRKDGTGSIRKDGASTVRTEPSAALRTPAGGVQIPQQMTPQTPLPGSLSTPLPGSFRTPLPMAAPAPSASGALMAQVARSEPAPPEPELTPDDTPSGTKPPAPPVAKVATPRPAGGQDDVFADQPGLAGRPKGGVVRRSGRLRTPLPIAPSEPPLVAPDVTPGLGAEPTLEAARAVDPEPEAPVAVARVSTARTPAPAPPRSWLVPVLGVVGVVLLLVVVVLGVMMSSAASNVASLSRQLDSAQKITSQREGQLAAAKLDLAGKDAAFKLASDDRDRIKAELDAARKDLEAQRAEIGRLKAEAAARASVPSVPAPAPVPAPGGK